MVAPGDDGSPHAQLLQTHVSAGSSHSARIGTAAASSPHPFRPGVSQVPWQLKSCSFDSGLLRTWNLQKLFVASATGGKNVELILLPFDSGYLAPAHE